MNSITAEIKELNFRIYLSGISQCPTGRVFQYWVGLGTVQNTGDRVGFGLGRSVEIYVWVFPVIAFTLGYFGYFRVYQVFTAILYIISFLLVMSKMLRFDGSSGDLEGIYAHK